MEYENPGERRSNLKLLGQERSLRKGSLSKGLKIARE